MKNRIFTVPNQLTFLRLAFLPFFIIAIKYDRYAVALGILIAAGISDGLDGLLARGLNQKTPLGAYLDPIADKLLLSTSYFVLALKGKIAWWLTILVMGRDVLLLVACAVILITVGYRPFPPSMFGKANTFFQILLIVLVLILAVWDDHALFIFREVCGYCVAAFVILSGFHYSIVVSRQLSVGE
jgi:cardiolipin synthase (CMP-forming)